MRRRVTPDPVQSLSRILEDIRAHPDAASGQRLAALVAALRPGRFESAESGAERVRQLLRLLEDRPEFAEGLARHLAAQLASRSQRILYADSGGVLDSAGLVSGVWQRLLGRLLPPAVDEAFLRDLIVEVFDHPRDHVWLRTVPLEDWETLLRQLGVEGPTFAAARRKVRQELLEAMRLVSLRLAALGTDPVLLRYLPALSRHESPFLAQVEEVQAYLRRHADAAAPATDEDRHLEVLLAQCEEYVDAIRRRSREAGVDVALVFLLARIGLAIRRLRLIRDFLGGALPAGSAGRQRVIEVFVELVRQENRRHSLRDLFRGKMELLARRVTEQASHSGEHYVSRTREELVGMYRAAAGAGLVIGAMALVKLLVAKLDLPLLWEAVAFSLNYGLGFVLIHVFGMTIATKQPAMTAATLAAALDGTQGREARLEALTTLAAEVSRSQWVSIAGNVTVGFVTALAIAMTAGTFLDWQPVDEVKAARLLHDLHPWKSLALLHAAIAGVYLFLSGLISGYYDNQALYQRVPQRLRRVRWLRTLLGTERLDRLAAYVEHNLGALAGNFLFGCMLGSTPVIGELLGLPLDIRHVAFASANLAYGLQALGFAVDPWTLAAGVLGVALIGLTNLLVSFALALKVALRSRGITPEQTQGLSARVLRRFLGHPREFFWVPRAVPAQDAERRTPGA